MKNNETFKTKEDILKLLDYDECERGVKYYTRHQVIWAMESYALQFKTGDIQNEKIRQRKDI